MWHFPFPTTAKPLGPIKPAWVPHVMPEEAVVNCIAARDRIEETLVRLPARIAKLYFPQFDQLKKTIERGKKQHPKILLD